MKAQKLLELIGQTTQEDLDEIDKKIAELNAEVASLGRVRTLMNERLHGRTQGRTKKAGKASGGGLPSNGVATPGSSGNPNLQERRIRVAKILGTQGPQLANVLADKLGVAPQGFHYTLQCDWFQDTKEGWRLTEIGRREALGQK